MYFNPDFENLHKYAVNTFR